MSAPYNSQHCTAAMLAQVEDRSAQTLHLHGSEASVTHSEYPDVRKLTRQVKI